MTLGEKGAGAAPAFVVWGVKKQPRRRRREERENLGNMVCLAFLRLDEFFILYFKKKIIKLKPPM